MLLTKEYVNAVDLAIFKFLFLKTESKRYKESSRLISKTGDGYLYVAIGVFALLFEKEQGLIFFTHAIVLFAIYLPLYLTLKHTFKRERPCQLLTHYESYISASDKFSMPSGHTSSAVLMAMIINQYYPEFGGVAFVWAGLIGLSRVTLGVHYPSDIFAGAMLGLTISLIGTL